MPLKRLALSQRLPAFEIPLNSLGRQVGKVGEKADAIDDISNAVAPADEKSITMKAGVVLNCLVVRLETTKTIS